MSLPIKIFYLSTIYQLPIDILQYIQSFLKIDWIYCSDCNNCIKYNKKDCSQCKICLNWLCPAHSERNKIFHNYFKNYSNTIYNYCNHKHYIKF